MNKKIHYGVIAFLLVQCFFQKANAQNWNPEDTLNVNENDTIRIDQFRNNLIDHTGQDLIDASFPRSWPLFGTNTRMAIGGYVKLDYIQDFNGGYDRFQYEIQNVPVPGDGRPQQGGYMNMHARESRINLDVRSITEKGMPLRVFFEFDLYNLDRGPFNQALRLRHFYGVMGRLLVGRTWGTGSDLFAIPTTVDFAAGDALTGTRRAQVRFEDKINDNINYAFALEMLEFPGIDGTSVDSVVGQSSMRLPLLVGRITKQTASGGRLFLSASVFEMRWDGMTMGPDDTALGWGFSFSGRQYFGKHYLSWMGSYGNGWGSQIVSTIGTTASAVVTPDGELETMPAWNLTGSFTINISPVLMTNIVGGWWALDPSQYRSDEEMKAGGQGRVNIIWSPVKSVNVGAEFMSLYRENVDGNSGIGNRLQFMIKYLF